MNDNERAAREWDRALERLAAEVTDTAYAVALRHGAGGSWVDLELGLWEALARTVWRWGRLPDRRAEGLLPGGSGSDRPPPVTVLYQEQE
ncbi:MAG TPA: hypothetical protein VKE74_04700 [Gemmataceae bacterium]|nr:hypothetical protein [Gemmataceae bacterium]